MTQISFIASIDTGEKDEAFVIARLKVNGEDIAQMFQEAIMKWHMLGGIFLPNEKKNPVFIPMHRVKNIEIEIGQVLTVSTDEAGQMGVRL